MNLSISPLPPFHPPSSRQRRRSNSSSNILTSTINVKAVRSPRRNENLDYTSDNSTEENFEDNKLTSSNRTIPRPPRLAFDTQHNLRIPMTPPSKQEYKAHHQNHQHMLLSYNNLNNSHHDYYHHNFSKDLPGKESRTTSFSSTKSNKSTQSMNKSLTAFYNERIEKRTSMAFDEDDDDICSDSDSDTTLSVSSSVCDDDVRESRRVNRNNRNNQLAKQVSLLRKEIDVVKSSLEGLQKDHREMLNEKKQLEQQYQEAKYEVTKTLECSTNDLMEYNELLNAKMEKLSLEMGVVPSCDNSDFSPFSEDTSIINSNGEWPIEYTNIMNNCVQQAKELEYLQVELEKSKQDFRLLLSFKEEIEKTLEEKEREYLEKLRECEAVANYQVGTIGSMEKLLKELEIKMDKLQNEQRQERLERHKHSSSLLSISSILSNGEKSKKKHAQKASVDIKNASLQNNSSNDNSTIPAEDLIPSYCLSPPQSRRQSCTNPITLFTDEERIRHQTRFCLAKRWVEDDEVSICQQAGCSVKFNLWNRRHHCRRCGNIFCGTHSAYSMLLFPDGSEDWGGVWSRVCESCFKDSK